MNSNKIEQNLDLYGKIPPQNIDAEEAVIGTLLVDKECFYKISHILQPDYFYKEHHRKIYLAICELFAESDNIDIITVTNKLKKKCELDEIGGAYYLAGLTKRIGTSAHIEYHASIIKDFYKLRKLIQISQETINMAYDLMNEPQEVIDYIESNLIGLGIDNEESEAEILKSLLQKTVKEIEEVSKRETALTGIPSGLSTLDRVTGGWQKSDLIILAGRPGMGKTSYMLKFAKEAAKFGHKGIVFSMEMSKRQITVKILSGEVAESPMQLRNGRIGSWQGLNDGVKNLESFSLYIDDKSAISVTEFKSKLRRAIMKYEIEIAFVDYITLMKGVKYVNDKRLEVGEITGVLKACAKEFNIPIIALSQLSRKVEDRGGVKKPLLSDLRESGDVEQDADMVIFVYRPEYYGIEADADGNSTKGRSSLIISKHRNGSLEEIECYNNPSLTKISDSEIDVIEKEPNQQQLPYKSNEFENVPF